MATYGIKNATASLHLRLPKSMLAEMKVVAKEEDAGGLSALVRRAVRQYILMQQNGGKAFSVAPTNNREQRRIPPQHSQAVEDELQKARASRGLYFDDGDGKPNVAPSIKQKLAAPQVQSQQWNVAGCEGNSTVDPRLGK